MLEAYNFVKLPFTRLDAKAQKQRLQSFKETMELRRSVREFSNRSVDVEILRHAIQAAGTAPSGANQQPWTYVLIANPDLKRSIRLAAEEEEKGYTEEQGVSSKQFLEDAPYLIALFKINYGLITQEDVPKRR